MFAFANDCQVLISGSADGTIFLFKLASTAQKKTAFSRDSVSLQPIGFVSMGGAIKSITVSTEDNISKSPFNDKEKAKIVGNRILVGLQDGRLMSGIIPTDLSCDNSNTYELPALFCKFKEWALDVPVPVAVVPAEKPNTPETKEESSTEETEEREDKNGKISAKKDKPEELTPLEVRRTQGTIISNTSTFSGAIFLSSGYFLVGATTQTADIHVRLCHVMCPSFSLLLSITSAPVVKIAESALKNFILVGMANGANKLIRFKLAEFLDADAEAVHETFGKYYDRFNLRIDDFIKSNPILKISRESYKSGGVHCYTSGQETEWHTHDIIGGSITGVATSFDDGYIITSGSDGGIFAMRIISERQLEDPVLGIADNSSVIGQPDDITDQNAYSIQETRMKSEKDLEIFKAEEKKQLVRNTIQELRVEFKALLQENEGAFASRGEISVDPFLEKDVLAEREEKIAHLQRELQWVGEKEALGPRKLRSRYLDSLEQEYYEINGIVSAKKVATFRTLKIQDAVTAYLQPILQGDKSKTADSKAASENRTYLMEARTPQRKDFHLAVAKTERHTGNKLEIRKQQRATRALLWKNLLEVKPDEKYEDPKDVAAIWQAQTHMGDFKLKSGAHYIVPEADRIDADKKKRQIMLLHRSINYLKQNFNRNVSKLRDEKMKLLDACNADVKSIEKINRDLMALGETLAAFHWAPKLDSAAFPETRDIVTAADILLLQRSEAESVTKVSGGDMGFDSETAGNQDSFAIPGKRDSIIAAPSNYIEPTAVTVSPVAGGMKTVLEYEKGKLISVFYYLTQSIDATVKEFDEGISSLRQERILLEGDLKAADIKLLLLYEEWVLLKEFEKFDSALAEKLNTKVSEKMDLDSKVLVR